MSQLEEAKAELKNKPKEGEIPLDMEGDTLTDKHPKSLMAAEKTVTTFSSPLKGTNSLMLTIPS
jgi:hypothetical protein